MKRMYDVISGAYKTRHHSPALLLLFFPLHSFPHTHSHVNDHLPWIDE